MIRVCSHPILRHALSVLRDRKTSMENFRKAIRRASWALGLEALRGLETRPRRIRTPLRPLSAPFLQSPPPCFVAVLRAGLAFLDGMLDLVPDASVGHIGLYRDEKSLVPVRYYVNLPAPLKGAPVFLLDPMLATGGSMAQAAAILKSRGAGKISAVSLIASRQGLRRFHRQHPGIAVYVAAVDPYLNARGFIIPGLGDAGDRFFGT
ncbi:MAG: uracil phosphoribosyltransferase [Elusimicrobia bacterium]|nr:uracil phosphoribosyltransferase [Elusimicrobiota bacterium]